MQTNKVLDSHTHVSSTRVVYMLNILVVVRYVCEGDQALYDSTALLIYNNMILSCYRRQLYRQRFIENCAASN